jgi:N-acyl-D-amino-acid deacylase
MDNQALLFRGVSLFNGLAAEPAQADVAVAGDQIVEVGKAGTLRAAVGVRVIDADGRALAPGFIDSHSHGDAVPFLDEVDLSKLSQGVTTEVIGNCGFSLAPCPPSAQARIIELCGRLFPPLPFEWSTFAELGAAIDARGSAVNTVPLVGHHLLRSAICEQPSEAADLAEVEAMRRELREALDAGAAGLSSGLIYPPGMFADHGELTELARELGPDRVYATHVRGEGRQVFDAVAEAVAVAEQAGCRLQISHLKAAGTSMWGSMARLLDTVEAAADRGVDVHFDVYPYTANSTMLASCLPPWLLDGALEDVLGRLRDPASLDRVERELQQPGDNWQNWVADSGWSNIVIASTARHEHEGVSIADLAARRATSPFRALVDVLTDNDLRVSMCVFAMHDHDVFRALAHPLATVGSDGLPPGTGGKPHPRGYGTFTRTLGPLVRDQAVLSLPEAITKMTTLPARIFGLHDRGVVAAGYRADLVLFDPVTVADRATYDEPTALSTGIDLVVVNGGIAYEDGAASGRRLGRRLRRDQSETTLLAGLHQSSRTNVRANK